ncbi:thioredoxin domain-containing protein [Streptomyces sp. BI20]|uniref:thioredoxin domain-containing protein n=1 Tax=Streptomyces sp. BI20 TaxID=3403460 RepID=UPI003C779D13
MAGKKNDDKRAARARLQAEREAQVRRNKVRGRLIIGGALVAALGIAAGVGLWVAKSNGSDSGSDAEAAKKPFVQPKNTSGEDGVVVGYGKPDAKDRISVWLDPRCPFCAGVEIGLGKTLKDEADAGKYRVEYHFATFLDGSLGGKGSKRALNALGAAVNEDPKKFMDYLQVLYKNHPEQETTDTFGSTAKLLEFADEVPGLRTPEFNKAVKELTYMPWVEKVSEAFYESGKKGTPAVEVNGTEVNVLTGKGIDSITGEQFKKLVAEHPKK